MGFIAVEGLEVAIGGAVLAAILGEAWEERLGTRALSLCTGGLEKLFRRYYGSLSKFPHVPRFGLSAQVPSQAERYPKVCFPRLISARKDSEQLAKKFKQR